MAVGKTLKHLVDKQGITLKQLAERAGISVQTLYSITSRDSAYVRQDTLQKIAAALNLSVFELMSRSISSLSDSRVAESLSVDQYGLPRSETKSSEELRNAQAIVKPGFVISPISDAHFEAILKNLGYSLEVAGETLTLRCPDGLILSVDWDEIFELSEKTSEQLRLLLLDLRERKQINATNTAG